MIRPLVIATYYLDAANTNGQLERLFFGHLPEDYKPVIITQKEAHNFSFNTKQKLVPVPINILMVCLQSLSEHTGLYPPLSLPDRERLSWTPNVYKTIRKQRLMNKVDYIHTINMPCSSHLIGYSLKKEYNIPWVAQFYDPWTDNGMRIFGDEKIRRKDLEYERRVAEYADIIIVPDKALRQSLADRYGKEIVKKIHILPFVADTDKIRVATKEQTHSGLVVSHIGTLKKNRNTLTFLKSVMIIKDKAPQLLESFKVNYVGQITDEELSFIEKEGLKPYVNVIGQVPEEECEKFYVGSDLFLLVDIDCSPNLFYPSKIIKYFCHQKPIIGIVKQGSTIREELEKTSNYTFDYDDSDSLAKFLEKAITDYPSICSNDTQYWKKFSVDNVLAEYDRIIKKELL